MPKRRCTAWPLAAIAGDGSLVPTSAAGICDYPVRLSAMRPAERRKHDTMLHRTKFASGLNFAFGCW